ncbi:hypothetical protein OPEN69S_02901 [Ottowia pentelensis]|jgi:hypothetical protein|mmetsp:Transcript_59151/g.139341  ORF Transcript_59151/g.139341 Transcript_59151/m.139341 type:complete len:226 (-) Transcript_59151:1196-1873(-)
MEAPKRTVADQTELRVVRFGPSTAGRSGARSVRPRQRRRSPEGLRLERNQSTCGLQAGQAVVKAIRCVSNLTRPVSWLGPASSGVYPHTKGTRCSAGGHRHRIPSTASGLLTPRSIASQGVRRPLTDGGSTSINGTATSAIRWSNDLLALQAVIGPCRTRTPLQKGTRAGESRGAREVCPAVGSSRRGRGRRGRQLALGRRCRGLDAPRLPAAASSIGCVPLQSG